MERERITGAVLGIVLILSLGFLWFLALTIGNTPQLFYWGLLIGTVLGVVTCFYLASTWDPINLRPSNPRTKKADGRIFWLVPIGIILARIFPQLLGEEISALVDGCGLSWFALTVGYMSIQAWRHRPR